MGAEVGAAAIAAAAQLGNAYATGKMNKKTRKMTVEENQKNRQFNWDMFHATNAWNDPKSQMARLKAAGINPHIAYQDKGIMNTSNANSSLGTQAVSAGNHAPQFDIGTVISALRQKAEIENINADTQNKLATAKNTETIAGLNAMDLENKAIDIALNNASKATEIRKGESAIELNDQNIKKGVQEVINLITQNEKNKSEIDLLASQKQYTDQQKANLIATLGVIRSQIILNQSSARLNDEKRNTEKTEQQKNKAYTSNLHQNTEYLGEMVQGKKTENYILGETGLSTSRSNEARANQEAKKALQEALGSEKDNVLKDLKLQEQELININRSLEAGQRTKSIFQPWK